MPPQSYNFFGQSPGQMDASSQSPQALAQQMQLQEYNNPTSPNIQSTQGGGMPSVNPQMLAKLMMANQSQQPSGIPSNAQSYNAGAGPLPWLPQNALPWSSGNG